MGAESDFIGLCAEGQTVAVLCEGCGWIDVDHLGACTGNGCMGTDNVKTHVKVDEALRHDETGSAQVDKTRKE